MVTPVDRIALAAWEGLFRAQVTLMRGFTASPVWAGRSTREYDVLFRLSGSPEGLRQVELAEGLLISQPSLSRMLERLCGDGLVERTPDPADGRSSVHRLTARGRELQREIGLAHARDVTAALTGALTPAEITALGDITDKLIAAAERR
ncbi:MarR family winged helix-turn-helix transcriptional regulator, partial [Leucobacter sp. M11]|uniref:MarR family winged helix-turn-helix transcriptional regulator n=1 Tax=Leucobacter sp. M11 TaxID=2993565 RepID=UPI002D809947